MTGVTTFATAYASVYDALYADKDYAAECDLIEEALRRYGNGRMNSILDLGCGTGSHAIRLAERGYELTGVDVSDDMLCGARAKSDEIRWILGDLRTVDAGGPFDAALMMFAVLSYQHANDDVLAALVNARRHLRLGGLLVLDTWYGPAVIVEGPRDRTKVVVADDGRVVTRRTTGELDVRRHLCLVRFRIALEDQVEAETHVVRFFFPRELELFLELAGFQLLSLSRFPTLGEEPDEHAWSVLVVGGAV